MSTRGLVCIVLNKEYKVAAYNHCDSYPLCLGEHLARFIIALTPDKLLKFKEYVANCSPYDKESDNIRNQDILENIYENKGGKYNRELEFANDSLFCEWCYVIDLDNEVLEVYKGFNKKKLTTKDRFYFLQDVECSKYYPVKLLKSYKFCDIVDDDIASLEE